MKATDLREKTVEDLVELQKSLARDVFQNRLKNFTNRLDDTSTIRKTKRDLARVITLLHERDGVATAAPAQVAVPAAVAAPAKDEAAEKPKAKSPSKKASASAKKGEAK